MGTKLSPQQQKLYEGIYTVLLNDWDPLGVSRIPEAQDEYNAYLPRIFHMVLEGAGASKIAEYLQYVLDERMGFGSSAIEEQIAAAEKIVRLGKEIGLESIHENPT